jgi:hypothetical protein
MVPQAPVRHSPGPRRAGAQQHIIRGLRRTACRAQGQRGYVFNSQTDTRVIAHLMNSLYDGDILKPSGLALLQLRGAYAPLRFLRDRATPRHRRARQLTHIIWA